MKTNDKQPVTVRPTIFGYHDFMWDRLDDRPNDRMKEEQPTTPPKNVNANQISKTTKWFC